MKYKIINMLALFLLSGLGISHMTFSANNIDFSPWAAYGDSLAACTPGVFKLPNSASKITRLMVNSLNWNTLTNQNRLYVTNEIVGWQNQKCVVNQTSYTQDAAATQIVIRCAYAKNDLIDIANNARDVSTGTSSQAKSNSTSIIINKSCVIETRR